MAARFFSQRKDFETQREKERKQIVCGKDDVRIDVNTDGICNNFHLVGPSQQNCLKSGAQGCM